MSTTRMNQQSTGPEATLAADPPVVILEVDQLVPLLAKRSCHLPGNDWWADWRQWFCNNHILFGICLHHPWHPVERWERAVALTASISFSLVATNVVYQMYVRNPGQMETKIISYNEDYGISYGMVLLWTLGGLCHSIFELIIWHAQACSCCERGGIYGDRPMSEKCRNIGSFLVLPVVLALLGLAIYLILLRASSGDDSGGAFSRINYYDNNAKQDDQYHDDLHVDVDAIEGIESFSFLMYSTVEMLLAWFVYFPIVGTIIFSGVLGCNGRMPILGGRPRDVMLVEEAKSQSKYFEM